MTQRALKFSLVLSTAVLTGTLVLPAFADDPPPAYYVSMRALTVEAVASFVTVERQASATRTTPIAGCDEQTYYATPADAQTIAAARAAGEVVQLHRAEAGGSVQASAIVCVIDGQGAT